MKCPNCGAELAAGQKFCNKCGFNVEAAQNQDSANKQNPTQPTNNVQNNGGSSNGPVTGPSGDQNSSQPNNGNNNNQGAGFHPNNGQNAGFNPNNSQNSGFQPNNNQNMGFNPNNSQNAGFNPNNNQNAGFNPNNGQSGFQPNNNGQNNFQPNNGQNTGFQPNGQQFNGNGQQGFNNQGQFNNAQGNYQQQPNGFSYMMPFLKSNSALAICAAIIIVLIAIFNWKLAGGVLVIAAIAWYFLADKNHDQALPFNNSISSFFGNVGGNSVAVENAETNKLKLIVGIAAAVSLLFLFVGNFIGFTVDITQTTDGEGRAALESLGISGSSFSFSKAMSLLNKTMTLAISGNSYASVLTNHDYGTELQQAKIFLSTIKWFIILMPVITLIFTFVKTKVSSIIRIISSALSILALGGLGAGLIALHTNDDQEVAIGSQFIQFGYSYYITLIASIVALIFAIRWLMINYRHNMMMRTQQMGNYNMQQNNFGNPNQGNFNGNQNIPNDPANFNNGNNRPQN